MVQSLDNLSLSRIFLGWFQAGKNLLSLDVMLSEINTKLQTLLSTNQENSKFFSKATMAQNKEWKCIIIKEQVVLVWVCITPMKVLIALLTVVSNLLYKETILYIWQQRTQYWRNMMVDLRIFSKKYMKNNIRNNLKLKSYGMNIDLLMIWLPIWLNLTVVLYGLVKIMMVMFNLIV